MKSYHGNLGAGLTGLVVKEHEMPKPGRREILMRVRANSLNFREISVLRGTYPLPVKPALVGMSSSRPPGTSPGWRSTTA
jgi:NADPH:quinone reductase-like Zn-dependent oxidoreductase